MLTQELSFHQRKELLQTLFGFDLININQDVEEEHWVVYDEDGEEFYGWGKNLPFDFSTLEGFFKYATHVAKENGYLQAQINIQKALGL